MSSDHNPTHTPGGHGATVMGKAFWDERYSSKPQAWSDDPHSHLVREAGGLAPGRALDVGTGQGADAIWLAERGWRVTAVDISPVALDRGRKQAQAVGTAIEHEITWLEVDLTKWEPPEAEFDLVSAQFIHFHPTERNPMYRRLAGSVALGGILLIVGHHPSDLETTSRRMPDPEPLFTAEEAAADLGSGWTVLAQDTVPRTEADRTGQPITVHDAVLRAKRTA